ncbi:tRNA-dihydrouridine synthase [Atractiella rhizophila]|nr:tRNA-dihydrouridine synthase [Atractiella rhizophila]
MSPREILQSGCDVNIAAPMVRYSKHSFRKTISRYGVHITHTPMILAQQFVRSKEARDSDFTTSDSERAIFDINGRKTRGCMIVQFATSAEDNGDFAAAAELVKPYCDGVDLNCGCPQSWAYKEHIGSFLLRHPERIADIVKSTQARVGNDFPISVKIRVDKDLSYTSRLMDTLLHLPPISHITVHGRTRQQSSNEPADLDAIRFCRELADPWNVPVVANGECWDLETAQRLRDVCGVKGVMSARGLLENPALFSEEGRQGTPARVIADFVQISTETSLLFPLFHRHLSFMMEKRWLKTKAERTYFNDLPSFAAVIDYLEENVFSSEEMRTIWTR